MALIPKWIDGKGKTPEPRVVMDEPLAIEPHVRSMIEDEGAVLLDLKAGRYYSLNGVGAKIWSKVEAGMAPTQILADLEQIYQVPAGKLASDLTAFVRSMTEKGLIRARA